MRVIVWRWQHPGSAVGDNSKKRRRGSVFPWFCASCFWNLCCLQRNHESTSHKATKKPHSIRLVMFGQGWLGHAWSLRYLKIWMALWKNDDPHIPDLKRDNKQSCQAHGRRKGSPRLRDRLHLDGLPGPFGRVKRKGRLSQHVSTVWPCIIGTEFQFETLQSSLLETGACFSFLVNNFWLVHENFLFGCIKRVKHASEAN